MRRTIIAAALFIVATPLFANDSPTATKFLRDYVGALKLIHAGDAMLARGDCAGAREQYAQARNAMESYRLRSDVHQSPYLVKSARRVVSVLEKRATCDAITDKPGQPGTLSDSAVEASWALANADTGIWIAASDRRQAIEELAESFGRVTDEPRPDQKDLEIAAWTLGYFLANPPDAVHDPWSHFVPPARRP